MKSPASRQYSALLTLKIKLSVISLAKMDLFWNSREFRDKHTTAKPRASPQNKGEILFYREKRELGGPLQTKSPWKETGSWEWLLMG